VVALGSGGLGGWRRKREESGGGALGSLNRSMEGKERERRGQHGCVGEKEEEVGAWMRGARRPTAARERWR
jgi:hypothetical protein